MAYNSAYTGSQVDAAVGAVRQKETKWDNKQDELTGTKDQLVGFNSAGEATAVAKPTYTATDVGAMPAVSGGTAGQVLTKTEAGQEWQDAPDGLPSGGEEGQVLTKTASGAQWDDVPSDIPTGGTQGQVLTKGDGETVEWSDPASGLPDGGTPGQMLYQGGSGPEWGDKPVMYVHITKSGGTYSADKTTKEIVDAVQNGYAVFASFAETETNNVYIPVSNCTSDGTVVYFCGPTPTHKLYRVTMLNEVAIVEIVSTSADDIDFTPGSTGLTSDNVQDAIEEVNEKIPNDYVPNTRTINSKPLSSNVTLTADDVGAGTPANSTTVTLTAAGWTGSAAPFSQQVSCSIVAADTAVVAVDVDTPGTDADADAEAINAWALCTQQNPTQGAGTLTFYCTEKPTINIPVKVGVA